ncbi:MAG TPA: L,D-transpeptidase family protein [Allosphingosinicella sp.]|nr:L,D-transpeptidase family protein [Allosphingosinicella sp.]
MRARRAARVSKPDFVLVGSPPRGERRRKWGLVPLFGCAAAALLGSATPPGGAAAPPVRAPLPTANPIGTVPTRSVPLATPIPTAAPAPTPVAPPERLIRAPAPTRTVERPAAPQTVATAPASRVGALRVLVSIAEQRAYVFRGGALIASSPVSTGKPGFETPTGTFPITQKKVHHHSNRYSNAPMPYMQRLTDYGVALHAGHVPGYPASHGCIRLPAGFARKLYAMTGYGTRVTVVRGAAGVSRARKKSRK